MSPETINRTQTRSKMGEAYASWYWHRRHKDATKQERVALILEYRKWRKLYATAEPERNDRDNIIWRDEDADRRLGGGGRGADRYVYDFKLCTPALGWKQFDTKQDAHYFGFWVNVEQRLTFTYCEGDRTLVECPDIEHLRAELADATEFYGDPPPMAVAFGLDGTRTEYYDTRPAA